MSQAFDLPLLVVRPEPGASATAGRARQRGWEVGIMPIFEVAPRDWSAPNPGEFDAIMLTSANACRHGGANIAKLVSLPAYCVGAATAEMARDAGFSRIVIGNRDADALADRLRSDGHSRILHLAGVDTRDFDESRLTVSRIAVYASEPIVPPDLDEYLCNPVIALIHSARAGEHFAELVDRTWAHRDTIRIAAISPSALSTVGGGWRKAMVATSPTDDALLDASERLVGA